MHNYTMRHLDETFIDLINMNILNMLDLYFSSFAKSISKNYCSHWDEEDDEIEEA